jgi:hypothetical protein
MKDNAVILAIATLTGCSAFTAPRDPSTGIFDLAS